jgi:hypothetical protein
MVYSLIILEKYFLDYCIKYFLYNNIFKKSVEHYSRIKNKQPEKWYIFIFGNKI